MTFPIVIAEASIDIYRKVRSQFESPAYTSGRYSDLRDAQRPLAHFLMLPGHRMDEAPKVSPR